MTKTKSSVMIGIIVLLICVLAFGIGVSALRSNNTAQAAEYEYDPAVNGCSWGDDGLTVCFTCTNNGLNMYNWTLFLFNSQNFQYVDYGDDHKLENSGNMGQDSASYYFESEYDDTQYVGTITVTFSGTTAAVNDSTKTLADIWDSDDWRVIIGPHHDYYGDSHNCDYYVGNVQDIARTTSPAAPVEPMDPNIGGKTRWLNGETVDYSGSVFVHNGSSVNPGVIEYQSDYDGTTVKYCYRREEDPDKGSFVYTFGETEGFIVPADGTGSLPLGVKLVGGDGTEEDPFVFAGIYPAGLEFTVNVTGETTRYIDDNNIGDEVFVTYKITRNVGINSLLLIPEYDTNVFGIKSVSVNETALGEATITNGDGVKKILVENTGDKYVALDGEEEFFLTVTYEIISAMSGEYEFGLDLTTSGDNNRSVAYFIENDLQKGEQTEVTIEVIKLNSLALIMREEGVITIGTNNIGADLANNGDVYGVQYDYWFTYEKTAVGVEAVSTLPVVTNTFDANDFTVYYTYNGDATVNYTWYKVDSEGNLTITVNGRQYTVSAIDAPMLAGEYFVELSAEATEAYYAPETKYGYVRIVEKNIVVYIADKTSKYRDAIVELTYTTAEAPFEGDDFFIALTTEATSESAVGAYRIIGGIDPDHLEENIGKYVFSFSGSWGETGNFDGTYTITGKAITLTALNQTAEYTGSEPEVDQTKYTITETETGEAYALDVEVAIGKQEGVAAGSYILIPGFASEMNGYEVTYVNGTFTITSVGAEVDAVKAYFAGLEKVYNGSQQDLLAVGELPAYYYYVASGNMQKDVNEYTITVTVNADGNHNIAGESSCVFTVDGEITPLAVTLTANDVNVYYGYGEQPVTPSFSVEGTTEELNYTYVITNNEEAFVPSATTPVGGYPIVVTAGNNPNFTVTTVNGVYHVNKKSVSINLQARNVYYNRALDITASATVNSINLNDNVVLTYYNYSDTALETPIATPVNAGRYWVKAYVEGTNNYYSGTQAAEFEIYKVQLGNVTFTYNHGNVTWTAVAQDMGVTSIYSTETGVEPVAIKEGTIISYKVKDGDRYVATCNDRTFDAEAATLYHVWVHAENDPNYEDNYTGMDYETHEVAFSEGVHVGLLTGSIPAQQYIFDGQTAIKPNDLQADGSTFARWELNEVTYLFTEQVHEDITLVARWADKTYTVVLKYLPTSETEGIDMFTIEGLILNETVSYYGRGVAPIKESDDAGIYYTFADKWVHGDEEYNATNDTIGAYTVEDSEQPIVFVAVFDTHYNSYTITYYFSENGSADYVQYGEAEENVVYGSTIAYRAFNGEVIPWFVADYWYGNEERTESVPTRMPAEDISVYGTYKFDIGKGDVNASGTVTADDITLYRQWIVGGYEMTVVESGDEWALVTGENYDAEARYFLKRVADINVDESKDIRDVSITRMALVGGYDWDITTGEVVSGQNVDRTKTAFAIASVTNGLNEYGRVRMYGDVTDATADVTLDVIGNIYLDLGGNTLTVNSLTLRANGKNAIITVKNGTIVSAAGITVAAPNGIVTIEDVTAYVDGSEINLQAADSSLHFAGAVEFYNGDTDSTTPATINVEAGTHVVVEETATVVVEKVVVTENFTAAPEASITIDNKTSNEVVVEGMIENSITTLNELIAAMNDGGDYVLGADIAYNGTLVFAKDTSINLNGHTLRSANSNAMCVTGGATLVVSGSNGNVIAQEVCVLALDGSKAIINGGNYTSYDNFVVGTNGTVKPDNDMGHNTITINAGTFNGGIQTAGYVACGIYVANSDTVVVNGGTFNVTNGVGILARSGNTTVNEGVVFNVTGDGHLGKVGDSKVTVPSGAVLVIDYAANYPGGDPVLTNDTAYDVYTVVGTVAELNAASGNVILGADIATNDSEPIVITGNMTLNLNGHTIASSNDVAIRVSGAQASLTIEGNGNVNAREGCVMAFYGASFVINGGTYTCTDNFVFGTNGTVKPDKDMGHNTITINAGTFNGEIVSSGYVACGVYVANSDTVVVNGGTFNVTNGVGILARSGNVTVNEGVVFNVTGDGHLGKVGDSKVTVPSGEVLVHDLAANYPGGEPTLTNNTEYSVYTVNQ